MIDELAGDIPVSGMEREYRAVYNDLNNPDLAAARARNSSVDPGSRSVLRNYGPEKQGYPRLQTPRELVAEAIRAYMADPNYLKTVAPEVAAAVRAAVNGHPVLSKIIQFNAIAPLGAGLLPAFGAPAEPKPLSDNPGSNAMHPSVALMLRNPMLRQAIEHALASRGRGGDTMIAHINPAEALMLRRLGGAGTINPRTGLREFTADPRGDIGGDNNHDNQPGNDAGMGGDVGNSRGGGGGYGHAGDTNGSGGGAGGGHSGGGHTVDNPPQPDFPQQPRPGIAPPPIAQPPAPIPVATAPMMSATATTDLTGGRFGKLPGWDLKPYQIGTAPTSYPTPGLTSPTVTQPPTGGGGGGGTGGGGGGTGGGVTHLPTGGGGGNGGLGGLGGDPNHPFGGDGSGGRNVWNQPGGTGPTSTGNVGQPVISHPNTGPGGIATGPITGLATMLGTHPGNPVTHLTPGFKSRVDGGGINTGPITGLARQLGVTNPQPRPQPLTPGGGINTGPVTGLLNMLTGGGGQQPSPNPQPHLQTATGGLGGLGGLRGGGGQQSRPNPNTNTARGTLGGGGNQPTSTGNQTVTRQATVARPNARSRQPATTGRRSRER